MTEIQAQRKRRMSLLSSSPTLLSSSPSYLSGPSLLSHFETNNSTTTTTTSTSKSKPIHKKKEKNFFIEEGSDFEDEVGPTDSENEASETDIESISSEKFDYENSFKDGLPLSGAEQFCLVRLPFPLVDRFQITRDTPLTLSPSASAKETLRRCSSFDPKALSHGALS